MLYKTIILELLQSHPKLHERLRLSRTLLKELDRYSSEFREAHLRFNQTHPEAAKELALQEIEERIAQEAVRYET